ncbi:MAG: hypothetical protein JOZ43_03340 [Acidobacteriales bacterium]|nr:hypothetical protein [Terriglobales bacterium]
MRKIIALLLLGSCAQAFAATKVTLDFTHASPIATYYQKTYGITFTSNAVVWNTYTYNPNSNPSYFSYVDPMDYNCATHTTTTCLTLKMPFSNNDVLQGSITGARTIIMNVPGGISGSISFQSEGSLNNSQVRVYSGLNGTGTLLTTIYVPASGSPARGCQLCKWSNEISLDPTFSATFHGVGKSVVFDQGPGGAGYIEYDNVTFNFNGTIGPPPGASTKPGSGSIIVPAN